MKHFKLGFSLAILFITLLLSSCMDSDGDTRSPGAGIVFIVDGGSFANIVVFKDDLGQTYTPTAASLANVAANIKDAKGNYAKRAYIAFYLTDESQLQSQSSLDVTKRKYDIELSYAVSIDGEINQTTHGSTIDTLAKCQDPILDLDKMTDGKYMLTSKGFLTAAIKYYMSKANHKFTLFAYDDETIKKAADGTAAPDTLDVYLGHNANGDTGATNTSLSYSSQYPQVYFKSFDVRNVVYKLQNEGYNEIVFNIKTKRDEYNGGINIKDAEYPVYYKFDLN